MHVPICVLCGAFSHVTACAPLHAVRQQKLKKKQTWITLFSWRFNYVIESMKSSITNLSGHFIYCPNGQMDMERAGLPVAVTFSAFVIFFFPFFSALKKK